LDSVPLSFKAFAKVCSLSALAIAGAWVLYTFPPTTSAFYPPCVFRMVTGLECPGCGTTRALHHLLHGRVAEAFQLNPMLFAVGIVGVFSVPSVLRGETPPFLLKRWFAWGAFIVVVGWSILRNVW
jgi:Protein of unknown function (DUF2752)